jgi:hypothetical protein
MDENLTVVIRTSGENTFEACKKLLLRQVGENGCVVSVTDFPFEKTLRRSYEEALTIGNPWAVIIDADILVSPYFMKAVQYGIRRAVDTDLGFSLKVMDRFYAEPKFRGVHVYQTRHLGKALEMMPNSGQELRPETCVKERMKEHMHAWRSYHIVVGLHDYYQHPYDVFSKMTIRAHRSADDIDELMRTFQDRHEKDFSYALAGLKYGKGLDANQVDNHRNSYEEEFWRQFGHIKAEGLDRMKLIPLYCLIEKEIFSVLKKRYIPNIAVLWRPN